MKADKNNPKHQYFFSRMKELGFDPDVDWAYFDSMPDEPISQKIKTPIFWPDEHGNIHIAMRGLDGDILSYDDSKAKSAGIQHIKPITRKRILDAIDNKYLPCAKGLGIYVWLSSLVIEAYKAGKKIKKLVITEGEFKAFKLSKHGIFTIAIPGITVWKEKNQKNVHHFISEIIKKCQVDEIIFLLDADLKDVKWKEGKDLYKRPLSFYTSVNLFKSLLKDYNSRRLTLAWVSERCKHKGIDDLLIAQPKDSHEIIRELKIDRAGDRKYIKKRSIESMSADKIKSFFHIQDKYNPNTEFYKQYEDEIGMRYFTYNGNIWAYDIEKEKAILKRSKKLAPWIIVGDSFMQYVPKPILNKHGEIDTYEVNLTPRKEAFARLHLGCHDPKEWATLKFQMEIFSGRVNIPSHLNYQQYVTSIDKFDNEFKLLNTYNEVTWKPADFEKEKNIENSLNMIKQIFGNEIVEWNDKQFPSYELGLEYMKVLWEKPTQILPILSLVSEERGTGKTKFMEWIRAIYGLNARKVSANDLVGNFTSYFADKLILYIDEAFVDKKDIAEKVKEMSTGSTARLEAKHLNPEEVQAYFKLIIASNNVYNFMLIDEKEVRFWVREISPIKKEDLKVNMLEELVKEIPFFLDYLMKRDYIFTGKDSRQHFPDEVLMTHALKRVQKESRWSSEIVMDDFIKEELTRFDLTRIRFTAKDIHEALRDTSIKLKTINSVLKTRWKMSTPKTGSIKYKKYWLEEFTNINTDQSSLEIREKIKSGMAYTFYASDFFEIANLFDIYEPDLLIKHEDELIRGGRPSFWENVDVDTALKIYPIQKWIEQNTDTHLLRLKYMLEECKGSFDSFWTMAVGEGVGKIKVS